jgi:CHAT domain
MAPNPDDPASPAELRIDITPITSTSSVRGSEYELLITAPDGASTRGIFRAPLSAWEIEAARDASSRTPAIQRSWATQTADFTTDVGTRLFDSLFAGRAGRLYKQAVAIASNSGTELRLRLTSPDRLITSLPWEWLYDYEIRGDFVVLSTGLTLVREVPAPPSPAKAVAGPLKVLLVAAPQVSAEVEQEVAELERLASDTPQVPLRVFTLRDATLSRVHEALAKDDYQVLHFAGHAGFEAQDPELGGLLLLSDSGGSQVQVPAETLVDALRESRDLRLTFLSGCGTDWIAWAVAGNVPAVLGMRGLISARARATFARQLYRSVLRGAPLEAAASDARRRINYEDPGSREWGAPVLYLREGETPLLRRDEASPAVRNLDLKSDAAVALDPKRQDELEYLNKKLTITRTNLELLRVRKEQFGDAASDLVASQIIKLEEEESQTSRRISELER